MSDYTFTRNRVEDYFDRTATKTWERLTSDAPLSKVRETVRAGRDEMRQVLLSCLPADLTGQRVLDAGCGAGQMSAELARRGADVVGVDISPSLIGIAQQRLDRDWQARVRFQAGDMLDPDLGAFDHVVAMDSLIYYSAEDIARAIAELAPRVSGKIVFTVAPRTKLLMGMWYAGKLFPRSDRSPVMIPQHHAGLERAMQAQGVTRALRQGRQVTSGFYISQAMEVCS
jgi:magnesium-protoporphyrin O-methyltransferase